MATKVVNIRTGAKFDIYCGRAGKGQEGPLGNPVAMYRKCPICTKVHRTGGSTLNCFRQYFEQRLQTDVAFRQAVDACEGKILACLCAESEGIVPREQQVCHAQVIAEYLDTRSLRR